MSRETLVRRLIAFLKRPDALDYEGRDATPHDSGAFEPQDMHPPPGERGRSPDPGYDPAPAAAMYHDSYAAPHHASRLDALLLRAVQQFHAQMGCVLRVERTGQLRYCTGRDLHGQYIPHALIEPNHRVLSLALDSGEAQLVAQRGLNGQPSAVLCGPLWHAGEMVGLLYLESPARSRLHRPVFDVFCNQAARMLFDGVA